MSDFPMGMYWVLDENHKAVPTDLETWAKMCGNREAKIVKQEYRWHWWWVSTVFLGLDHNWDDGPPHLFETMIFFHGGKRHYADIYQRRYSTWDEALAGHQLVVKHFPVIIINHYLDEAWYALRRFWRRLRGR